MTRGTTRASIILILIAIATTPASAEDRVSFRITAVTSTPSSKSVLSETVIDGPGGTDFTIDLVTGPYQLVAEFIADHRDGEEIIIRCKLDTRRLHGRSPQGLPLFEIDHQEHDFTVSSREQLVLLPFGGPSMPERLEIRIIPSIHRATGPPRPIEITTNKRDSSGSIQVKAFTRPHHFLLTATVQTKGNSVTRTQELFIDEDKPLLLAPGERSSPAAGDLVLVPRIEADGNCAGDSVAFVFDLFRVQGDGSRRPLLSGAAGVAKLGERAVYDLSPVLGADAHLSLTYDKSRGD